MFSTNKLHVLISAVLVAASAIASAEVNPTSTGNFAGRPPMPYVPATPIVDRNAATATTRSNISSRGGSSSSSAAAPPVVDISTSTATLPSSSSGTTAVSANSDDQNVATYRGGSAEATVCEPSPKKITLSTKAAVLAGCALAFNGGYVNGATLSGILSAENVKQASAAVTGAWTNSALGIATGNYAQALFNAKCIGSYMGGSLIASLCNPFPKPFEISIDRVSPAFLIGSLLLYASSSVASKSGGSNKAYIYLAAIACGIQNSVTSVLTSNLVRSAHFSGITSDIGTFLGQVIRGNSANAMKLRVFCCLAASFWTGGLISFSVTDALSSSSLLISSAFFFAIAVGLMVA